MKLHDFIRHVRAPLLMVEAKVVYDQMTAEGRLVVSENPTRKEIAILLQKSRGKELRALLGMDRIFVWDAWLADHNTVGGLIGTYGDFEQLTINTHNSLDVDLADAFRYEPSRYDDGEPQWDESAIIPEVQGYMPQYPFWRKLFMGWHYSVRVTIADNSGWADDLYLNMGPIV